MKKLKWLLAATLTVTLLAGCSSSGGSSDTVTLMVDADLMSMDSGVATDGTSFAMIQACIDGLYGYDKDGNLELALAEKEEISDDGLVYTYTLRDVNWSNGDPVTANDFVYSWRRLITNASEYTFLLGPEGANVKNYTDIMAGKKDIKELGIVAKDDKTVEVTLESPVAFANQIFAFPVLFPINEKYCEELGDQYGLTPENLLYCGAYKLVNWEKGAKVDLVKNEDYYDAEDVKTENLTVLLSPDLSAAAVQFDNGDLDFTIINSSLIDQYQDSDSMKSIAGGFLWYLQPDDGNEDLENLNIRKGISAAIDREDFVNNILKDGSIVPTGYHPHDLSTSPSGTDFADDCGDLLAKNGNSYDLAKAQEYIDAGLKELGKDSITFTLMYGDDEGSATEAATYVKNALDKLKGVNCELSSTQKKSRLDTMKTATFDCAVHRWGPDFGDPTTYLNNMQHSQWGTDEYPDGNNNYGHYFNPEYDKLMAQARAETDLAKRWDLLIQCNEILMADLPIIPLYEKNQAVLQNPDLKGLINNPTGTPWIYKYVEK